VGADADPRSDRLLATAAARGESGALDSLLARHVDRINAVCRRILGNDHDAADATQDALLAIVKSIRTFDGRAQFSTWCYRIATNAALDETRRRRRRPEPNADVPDRVADAEPATDERVAAALDVDAALAQLTPEFRAAVVLRDIAGLDYGEIATVLGIPPGTVRSRIARGRAALADRLGNPHPPPNVQPPVTHESARTPLP
jgi:RNA polymerase sigma-70 factor (ECF subfamily)